MLKPPYLHWWPSLDSPPSAPLAGASLCIMPSRGMGNRQTRENSAFFKLSPEIRIRIYSFAFAGMMLDPRQRKNATPGPRPNILCVSRTWLAEAKPILLQEVVLIVHPEIFLVDLHTRSPIWNLSGLDIQDLSRVQSIRIHRHWLWAYLPGLGALPSLRKVTWTIEKAKTMTGTLDEFLAGREAKPFFDFDLFSQFHVDWEIYLQKLLTTMEPEFQKRNGEILLEYQFKFADSLAVRLQPSY